MFGMQMRQELLQLLVSIRTQRGVERVELKSIKASDEMGVCSICLDDVHEG